MNPVKGVRLEMAADVERLVLGAIDRLGPAGLGHELTVLDDDDCAFENMCERPYSAFAMKRFETPFSRPFRDRFGPFFGVLVPVSGILGARRRRRRKNGEKTT